MSGAPSSSSNGNAKASGSGGGVGPSRRTWDVAEYAQRAKDREQREREHMEENDKRLKKGLKPLPRRRYEDSLPEPTSDLQARAAPLDLDKNVGKTLIVDQVGRRGPGYYCEVCRKTCKDSIGYLDHLNGWSHLRRLGQSTHAARSTPEAVRARIESHRARLATAATSGPGGREYDFLARVEEIAKREREEKERKREEKRERKRVKREEEERAARGGGEAQGGGGDGGEDEMMKMMGFGGFGSSKK